MDSTDKSRGGYHMKKFACQRMSGAAEIQKLANNTRSSYGKI